MEFTQRMFLHLNKTPYIVGEHHKIICDALDHVAKGDPAYRKLIINISPRFGKTLLVSQMFIAYGLALNPLSKFIHLSYSGQLTMDNSMAVKDIINSDYYQSVFATRIRKGSDTKSKWMTEQGGGEYATSTLCQITGFGAGLVEKEDGDEEEELDEFCVPLNPGHFNGAIVIDDPIRPEDALSDLVREKVNRRFETTIRNRVNSRNTPIIIIMQRLHEHDLCGYLQEVEPDEWKVISLPALYYDEKGNECALWPFKFTVEELHKLREVNPFVFDTQYMQNPKPMEGLMYSEFKTYEELPSAGLDKCYTDPADTGSDYHCAIFYREYHGYCFVTDVLYTQDDMDITEPKMVRMLAANGTKECYIEGNGAGRLYSKNVERRCREAGNSFTKFIVFNQSQNKAVRIYSRANEVNNVLMMPSGWNRRWPKFYNSLVSFRKEGSNAHDDSCFVAGTMVATVFGDKPIENVKVGDRVITPFGIRRVLASGCTGVKDVIDRFGLSATADHHVYNNGCFVDLDKCKEEDLSRYSLKEQILWRYRKLLCSMELNTDLWGRESIILASQKAMRGGSMPKDFMLRFGKMLMGWKFRKAIAFIIKTETLSIMTSVTWSAYRCANICRIMARRICKILNLGKGTKSNLTLQEKRLMSGIEAKKAGNGTANTQRARRSFLKTLYARTVGSIFSPSTEQPCSAAMHVEKNIGVETSNTSEYASNVERSSDMGRVVVEKEIGNSAVFHAVQHTQTCTEKVYNIKVDKDGCYYANGILVSNCDAVTGVIEMMNQSNGDLSGIFF